MNRAALLYFHSGSNVERRDWKIFLDGKQDEAGKLCLLKAFAPRLVVGWIFFRIFRFFVCLLGSLFFLVHLSPVLSSFDKQQISHTEPKKMSSNRAASREQIETEGEGSSYIEDKQ